MNISRNHITRHETGQLFKKFILKGLEELNISFEPSRITAIFGENGCGKSTILHAIACMFMSDRADAETNYFTRFFKKVEREAWVGSCMEAFFKTEDGTDSCVYKKGGDRWIPRINKRACYNTYYIGIDSCVPAIEKESATRTAFTMRNQEVEEYGEAIAQEASNILCKQYRFYAKSICGNKQYQKVAINNGPNYTSLSMGAGEQRLFTILHRLFTMPENSLLLIDELDLTL